MRHFSGEFEGMRPLMADEIEAIAGGDGEDTDDVTTLNQIVVKPDADGTVMHYIPLVWSFGFGGNPGTTLDNPEPSDNASISVDVNISRTLSDVEKNAIEQLKTTVDQLTFWFDGIDNNATMQLSDGRSVSGSELKSIWSMTDFVVNDNVTYGNGTTRSEADWNGGNPFIQMNLGQLVNYVNHPGGMNYLILHELGHMTSAGRDMNSSVWADGVYTVDETNANEQYANDIARGIANSVGAAIVDNPTYGYGGSNPTFTTPAPPPPAPPPPPPPSGGGGGGGGGGTNPRPPQQEL